MHSTKSNQIKEPTDTWMPPVYQCGLLAGRVALLVGLAVVCSGCSLTKGLNNYLTYNDNSNDFVMGWRNSVWATQAWHNEKRQFVDHPEFRAFGNGYRDGYQAVASGGNGCPPPLPPRRYWTWKYQTPEGQSKVAAWFEGYSYGATAAEADGAGNFQDIQVSYAIETQYSPEFQAGQIPSNRPNEFVIPGEPTDSGPHEPIPAGLPDHAPPVPTEVPELGPVSWQAPAPTAGWPPEFGPPNSTIPR